MFRVWELFPNYTELKKKQNKTEKKTRKMRGDEIKSNWDHPQKGILWVFMLPPPSSSPAFQSYSALCRPPGKALASQGMWCQSARAHVCMCVWEHTRARVFVCSADSRWKNRASFTCWGCLGVQRLSPGARFTPNTTCQAKWNSHYF